MQYCQKQFFQTPALKGFVVKAGSEEKQNEDQQRYLIATQVMQ
jgi:hypothetical protein